MQTWKNAQEEVLARLAEARKLIEARDEGGVIAIVNQQDAFCDAAKERQPREMAQVLEKQCHYCQGFLQSGGCMGRLNEIDRAVMHGEWDEARRLLDEYVGWIKSLDVKA
jgi:hypothetical protein